MTLFIMVFHWFVLVSLTLAGPCVDLLFAANNPNLPALQQYALFDSQEAIDRRDIRQFRAQVGIEVTRRNSAGRAVEGKIRVLSDNNGNLISILADFNDWGKNFLPEDHLKWVPGTPYYEGKVRELHDGMEYRLMLNGKSVLDPAAAQFTTPEMIERFRPGRTPYLNSVFSDVEAFGTQVAKPVDFRGRPVLISEISIYELAEKWSFRGQTGPSGRASTYRFIAESGLAKAIAERGYTHIEFLPFNSSMDGKNWQMRYQVFGLFGPDSRYGTPEEFRQMVAAFRGEGVGVIMDAVLGHYPFTGNEGVRAIDAIGVHQFINGFGKPVFGSRPTVWGTYRWDYENPFVRRFLIDSVVTMFKQYGLSGMRIDNVDGVREQPMGNQFLRELSAELRAYVPEAVVLGEMFSDQTPSLTSVDRGGMGFHGANDVDFFYSFVQRYLQAFDDQIQMERLESYLGDSWRWDRVPMQRWVTNHDEAANPQPGASGQYVASLVAGGGWSFVEAKSKVWGTLGMTLGSIYLDMPQMRLLQEGSFNSNPAVDWSLLKHESQMKVDRFFTQLTKMVRDGSEFLPENLHPAISNHLDHDNKVISLMRLNYKTMRKTYTLINLGSRRLTDYSFGVDATRGKKFEVLLNSDSKEYAGQGLLRVTELAPRAEGTHGKPNQLVVPVLAPMSALILREAE
ncbi:MAG: alpha amylase C-terminal domain-containing protein [Deltaproteobacteria bacterium]|nr:alpha amylase C-terminal domain-containing protein [Deltaproteobacteria bacterium]MBI3293850.1 alpha amylase C-terminal domain-containing protein [Deltaproteobacteria bacterium]